MVNEKLSTAGLAEDGGLDRYDRLLLDVLQSDARLTGAELAERVALSISPCWRRVKRLEAAGYIRGYQARLDPKRLGYDVIAFVSVMLDSHRHDLGLAFEDGVRDIPQIVACHNVSGRYDFLLEVLARDLESYGEFARDILRKLPGVKEINSSFSLKAIKQDRRVPL
ncbi:MAG: Lrp/AsnC family transcriptional regulator [Betaproteobacteria bacterium]|nr:Lrp/AsnC family transcriptional regulator [Betaproteobacteria bacterium]